MEATAVAQMTVALMVVVGLAVVVGSAVAEADLSDLEYLAVLERLGVGISLLGQDFLEEIAAESSE